MLILESGCEFCSHCELVPGLTRRNSCNKTSERLSCSHQNSPIVSLMFQHLRCYLEANKCIFNNKIYSVEYSPDLSSFWGAHGDTLYIIVNPNVCFERTAYSRKIMIS